MIWQRFVSVTLPDFLRVSWPHWVKTSPMKKRGNWFWSVVNSVIRALRLLTDENKNPDNKAQFNELLKEVMRDERTRRAVLTFAIELGERYSR